MQSLMSSYKYPTPRPPIRKKYHFRKIDGLWFLEVKEYWDFFGTTVVAPTWQECWEIYKKANERPRLS